MNITWNVEQTLILWKVKDVCRQGRGREIFAYANENGSVYISHTWRFLRRLYTREISTNRWCCLDEALLRSYFEYSGVCTQAASMVCTAGITGMLSYDRIIRGVLSLSLRGDDEARYPIHFRDDDSRRWFGTPVCSSSRKTLNKFTSARDSAHSKHLSAPRKSRVCQELRSGTISDRISPRQPYANEYQRNVSGTLHL